MTRREEANKAVRDRLRQLEGHFALMQERVVKAEAAANGAIEESDRNHNELTRVCSERRILLQVIDLLMKKGTGIT